MKKKRKDFTESPFDMADEEQTGSRTARKLRDAAEAGLMELSTEMCDILLKASRIMKKDIAVGTKSHDDGHEYCPVCDGIVGQSAFYCKHCGQKLREGGRG